MQAGQENKDLIEATKRVYAKVMKRLPCIEAFISEIPNEYSDILIVSENRKTYYLETFKIRLKTLEEVIRACD